MYALLEQAARLTLGTAIFTSALRVGWSWTRAHLRDLFLLLIVGLPIMSGLSWVAFRTTLHLDLLVCMLLGTIVAPTDPVLAQSVGTSRTAEENVPIRLRHLISLESAANDGLALFLVMIPLLLLDGSQDRVGWDLARVGSWEVGAALALGSLFGWLVGHLVTRLGDDWLVETGEMTVPIAMALATLGGAKLLDTDGLFAVFGAALGIAGVLRAGRQWHHVDVSHAVARLFHLPMLVLFGLALPLDRWIELGWPLVGAVVLVLLLRRLPMLLVLKLWLRATVTWPDAVFVGWFGPIGIAALLYAILATERTGQDTIFVVVSAVITGSVIAHGLTDLVGIKLLASDPENKGSDPRPERPPGPGEAADWEAGGSIADAV